MNALEPPFAFMRDNLPLVEAKYEFSTEAPHKRGGQTSGVMEAI